jgi:hypothetical protein
MAEKLASYMIERFRSAAKRIPEDMETLAHDDLIKTWGDGTRCAYDVIYELAVLNKRQAQIIRGEDPGQLPWTFGEDWLQAPDAYRTKPESMAFFNASTDEVLSECEKLGDEPAMMEGGEPTKLFKGLSFAVGHIMYHDAQLNFIQSLKGDMDVHWS